MTRCSRRNGVGCTRRSRLRWPRSRRRMEQPGRATLRRWPITRRRPTGARWRCARRSRPRGAGARRPPGSSRRCRAYERAIALWDSVPEADRPSGEDHVELLFETSGAFHTAGEAERARDAAALAATGVRCGPPAAAICSSAGATGVVHLPHWRRRRSDPRPGQRDRPARRAAAVRRVRGVSGGAGHADPVCRTLPRGRGDRRTRDRDESSGRNQRIAEIEAMGVLGAALAIVGECDRGLEVLRQALAKAHELGDPVLIGARRISRWQAHCSIATRSTTRSRWAWRAPPGRVGLRVPLNDGGREPPAARALREATAIIASMPNEFDGGVGWSWNGVFAGIIAVRTGRLDEAQALHEIRSVSTATLADARVRRQPRWRPDRARACRGTTR